MGRHGGLGQRHSKALNARVGAALGEVASAQATAAEEAEEHGRQLGAREAAVRAGQEREAEAAARLALAEEVGDHGGDRRGGGQRADRSQQPAACHLPPLAAAHSCGGGRAWRVVLLGSTACVPTGDPL
eukprot:COSAG01_NODE_5314_length_4341_cov_8.060820_3_plen_129_part_00